MNRVSADKPKTWETRQERPALLEIVLLKRTYMLPWSQFLYAEGDEKEVRIAFPMHEVTIRGAGLQLLLADLADQRIGQLHEPSRADQFEEGRVPCIREIRVSKMEERS
jgi:hypothetical protein